MARWVGPDSVVVDVISLIGKDEVRRTVYRLRRYGRWVADCRTLEELAGHVDLATLQEEQA